MLHCYTGGRELAMKAISLGLSISFTGILTFKKSQALRDLAAELPADRIMVETDAPYLAPGKFRGKRNEPSYVVEIAKVLAETRGGFAGANFAPDHREFLPAVLQGASGMTLTLTILGCGSSAGVPRPALGWGACDPSNPKNRRRRCSLLAERTSDRGVTRVLIDTSPDLREQLIDAHVDHLDAVFLTHEHADQTHGIDDLRSVVMHMRRRIPVYFNQSTAVDILMRFSYCFVSPPGSDYPPILDRHGIEPVKAAASKGRAVRSRFRPSTCSMAIFRHSAIASPMPPIRQTSATSRRENWRFLEDLDLWIIDGLRYAGHPSHFSVNDALSWIDRFKPRRAVITNMHSDLDYEVLRQSLPQGIVPAYDGMRLTLERAG